MNCPLCDSTSTNAFYSKGFPINDCTACGHRFTAINADEAFINSVYGLDYFTGGGAGYVSYLDEEQRLIGRGREYGRLLRKYLADGISLLDVGAAAGFLLKGMIDTGWTGVGLEPNREISSIGTDRFGLHIVGGTLEQCEFDYQFDAISMVQVIGHLYSPRVAFKQVHKLLRPKGVLLIESWDRNSATARVFGRHWHEYSPPSVLQFFSRDGLGQFLGTLGFSMVDFGSPKRSISGAHAKSLLKYRLGDFRLLDFIPDKISIPYPGRDLFWAVYQKV